MAFYLLSAPFSRAPLYRVAGRKEECRGDDKQAVTLDNIASTQSCTEGVASMQVIMLLITIVL